MVVVGLNVFFFFVLLFRDGRQNQQRLGNSAPCRLIILRKKKAEGARLVFKGLLRRASVPTFLAPLLFIDDNLPKSFGEMKI